MKKITLIFEIYLCSDWGKGVVFGQEEHIFMADVGEAKLVEL